MALTTNNVLVTEIHIANLKDRILEVVAVLGPVSLQKLTKLHIYIFANFSISIT